MVRYQIKLESGGKITLPKKILQELNLKEGDEMTVQIEYRGKGNPYLFIYPLAQEAFDKLFPKEEVKVK